MSSDVAAVVLTILLSMIGLSYVPNVNEKKDLENGQPHGPVVTKKTLTPALAGHHLPDRH